MKKEIINAIIFLYLMIVFTANIFSEDMAIEEHLSDDNMQISNLYLGINNGYYNESIQISNNYYQLSSDLNLYYDFITSGINFTYIHENKIGFTGSINYLIYNSYQIESEVSDLKDNAPSGYSRNGLLVEAYFIYKANIFIIGIGPTYNIGFDSKFEGRINNDDYSIMGFGGVAGTAIQTDSILLLPYFSISCHTLKEQFTLGPCSKNLQR